MWHQLFYLQALLVAFVAVATLSSILSSTVVSASFPECNVATNCSSHASSVTNATPDNSVCTCSCSQQWSGESCAMCPTRFNQTTCNSCASGYNQSTFPMCNITSCSQYCNTNFTRSVGGTPAAGCNCVCRGQAIQPTCECPIKYVQNPAAQCSLCAFGYDQTTYPECIKSCNLTSDCPPRTVSVSGNIETGCKCVCLGGWTGANCTVCPPSWDEPSGCISCASGYSLINGSCIVCGVANCSYHGSPIVSTMKCACSCQNQWTGDTCDACPTQYDINNNCLGCNTEMGYKDVNGVCVAPCTSFENCTNRATDPVLLNMTSQQCDCVCKNKWSGLKCAECLYPYDITADCAKCLPGMRGYPNCTNISYSVSFSKSPGITPSVPLKKLRSRTANTTSITFSTSSSLSVTNIVKPKPSESYSNTTTMTPSKSKVAPPTQTKTGTSRTSSSTHNVTTSKTHTPTKVRRPTRTPTPSISNHTSQTSTLSSLTKSATPTMTDSLCANTIGDCLFRTNNSLFDEPPVHCFCQCRNQWSEMFCNYCRPRYNKSADCGECYDGYDRKFVIYPTCDNILYIKANLTVPLRDASVLPQLVRDDYFRAIAADVTTFINETLQCNQWSHNITAYVISWLGGSNFVIDMELLDLDVPNNTIAAQCVLDGLTHNLRDLEFTQTSVTVARVGGAAEPTATSDSLKYFDLSKTTIAIDYKPEYNRSATPINSCAPYWCHNIPPITDPETADLTWVIVLFSIIGAILLSAASVYFLWYRPREQFRLAYRYKRGADVDYRRVRDMGGLEVEWCAMVENGGLAKVPLDEESIELSSKTVRRFSVAHDTEKPVLPSKEQPETAAPDQLSSSNQAQPAEEPSQPPQPSSKQLAVLSDVQKEMFETI
jgi:hypothetical protein